MRRGAALLAVLALGACGGEPVGEDRARPQPQALERTYTDGDGARREVEATLGLVALHPPTGRLPVALPEGTSAMLADVEIEDRGADPFPLQWAAFSARTRAGRTLREQLRLPPRRVRDGVQLVSVGFAVPEGDELADVRVRSIVDVWPFRATLTPAAPRPARPAPGSS